MNRARGAIQLCDSRSGSAFIGSWFGRREVLRQDFPELVQKRRQRVFVVCRDGYNFALATLSQLPGYPGHGFSVKQVGFVQNEQGRDSGKVVPPKSFPRIELVTTRV